MFNPKIISFAPHPGNRDASAGVVDVHTRANQTLGGALISARSLVYHRISVEPVPETDSASPPDSPMRGGADPKAPRISEARSAKAAAGTAPVEGMFLLALTGMALRPRAPSSPAGRAPGDGPPAARDEISLLAERARPPLLRSTAVGNPGRSGVSGEGSSSHHRLWWFSKEGAYGGEHSTDDSETAPAPAAMGPARLCRWYLLEPFALG